MRAMRWLAALTFALLVASSAAATPDTSDGGPCAALLEIEDDYIKEKQTEVFNIVDPDSSVQCTWSPSEQRICKGVGGACNKEEL